MMQCLMRAYKNVVLLAIGKTGDLRATTKSDIPTVTLVASIYGIQYTNMPMDCRQNEIMIEQVESHFSGEESK